MPIESAPLTNVTQAVCRPVVIKVTQDVMAATKIPKDTPIYFANPDGDWISAGGNVEELNAGNRDARFSSEKRVVINAREIPSPDLQQNTVVNARHNVPLFYDSALEFMLSPIYTSMDVEIDFTFTTNSREEARKWRSDVMTRYLQGRWNLEHSVDYAITLPRPVWDLVTEIFTKREKFMGYGERFGEYLRARQGEALTIIGNENGQQVQLSIAARQALIQGYFDFQTSPPEPEHDKEVGTWSTSFQYRFNYQSPTNVLMEYPMTVHQQFLESKFLEFTTQSPDPTKVPYIQDQTGWSMKMFRSDVLNRLHNPIFPYVRIPHNDEFKIDYSLVNTGTFLLVLLTMTPDEGKLLFNLRELGDVFIDPDILDFIANVEYEHLGVPGKSIFHFDVYRGRDVMPHPSIRVDKDLNVWLQGDINYRKEYRVRMALFTHLGMVSREACCRLMAHPKAFVKILSAINETLKFSADFQQMFHQDKIYPWQFTMIGQMMTGMASSDIYGGSCGQGEFDGAAQWPGGRGFMSDIPRNLINAWSLQRRDRRTVSIMGVCAYRKENADSFVQQMTPRN